MIIGLILIWSCTNTIDKNQKLINALNDTTVSIRGNLIELSVNDYRFDYYDLYESDSHGDYLTQHGYQGGGPSWKGIVYGAIKLSDPSILSKIRFDEEADGLAIWCTDKETLEKIGRLISVVKSDSVVMQDCIMRANKSLKME